MLSKSQAAFILSCRKFFATRKTVYFWTFTFKRCWPDWYYPRSWNVFIKILQNHYGGFLQGLRVLEVHPGGHGLHYHAIVDQRMSVHIVRRLAQKVGMGRIQVETASVGAAEYLAKYLAKSNPLWPGMRRWGTIGGFRAIKTANIEVESAFHRNVFFYGRGKRLPFLDVGYIYQLSRLHGEMSDWPDEAIQQVKERLKISLDNSGKPDNILGDERKAATGRIGVTLRNSDPF